MHSARLTSCIHRFRAHDADALLLFPLVVVFLTDIIALPVGIRVWYVRGWPVYLIL